MSLRCFSFYFILLALKICFEAIAAVNHSLRLNVKPTYVHFCYQTHSNRSEQEHGQPIWKTMNGEWNSSILIRLILYFTFMDRKLLVIFSIKSVAAALEKAIDLSSSSQVVLVPCVQCTPSLLLFARNWPRDIKLNSLLICSWMHV